MSHELRTPLNSILGFSQLFGYDQSLSRFQQSNALEINRAGKYLMALLDELLDLSRIESGSISLSVEPVLMLDIINESLSWVSEMANSHGISIKFNSTLLNGILVKADTIRLKQVF